MWLMEMNGGGERMGNVTWAIDLSNKARLS